MDEEEIWQNAVNEIVADQRQAKPWCDEEICNMDIDTLVDMEEESINIALSLERKNPTPAAPTTAKGKSGKGRSRGRGRGVPSK